MDEIAGFRARSVFASHAPADFADARQDIGDRLLLSMMMDARRPRVDLEQPAPQRRSTPSCGATAARRTEPGVCAVPESNPAGPTMQTGDIRSPRPTSAKILCGAGHEGWWAEDGNVISHLSSVPMCPTPRIVHSQDRRSVGRCEMVSVLSAGAPCP